MCFLESETVAWLSLQRPYLSAVVDGRSTNDNYDSCKQSDPFWNDQGSDFPSIYYTWNNLANCELYLTNIQVWAP